MSIDRLLRGENDVTESLKYVLLNKLSVEWKRPS